MHQRWASYGSDDARSDICGQMAIWLQQSLPTSKWVETALYLDLCKKYHVFHEFSILKCPLHANIANHDVCLPRNYKYYYFLSIKFRPRNFLHFKKNFFDFNFCPLFLTFWKIFRNKCFFPFSWLFKFEFRSDLWLQKKFSEFPLLMFNSSKRIKDELLIALTPLEAISPDKWPFDFGKVDPQVL